MPETTPDPPASSSVVKSIVTWVIVAWMALNTIRGCEGSARLTRIEEMIRREHEANEVQRREVRAILEGLRK